MKIDVSKIDAGVLINFLLMYGPGAYTRLVELFHAENPTKDQWLGLIDDAAAKRADDYVAAERARVEGGAA